MEWLSIKKKKPMHGQKVFVYCDDMDAKEFLKEGFWPILIWNEETQEFHDKEINGKKLCVSHWLPMPILPIGTK